MNECSFGLVYKPNCHVHCMLWNDLCARHEMRPSNWPIYAVPSCAFILFYGLVEFEFPENCLFILRI